MMSLKKKKLYISSPATCLLPLLSQFAFHQKNGWPLFQFHQLHSITSLCDRWAGGGKMCTAAFTCQRLAFMAAAEPLAVGFLRFVGITNCKNNDDFLAPVSPVFR